MDSLTTNDGSDVSLKLQRIRDAKSKNRCDVVFEGGELIYNCRDCQADPTCVLCAECFRKSNHDNHNIRFHLATKGGCCDCGDVEAIAISGTCRDHDGSKKHVEDFLLSVNKELASILFSVLCEIIYDVLSENFCSYARILPDSSNTQIPNESLKLGANTEVVVYLNNDDVHTYDEVTSALLRPPFSFLESDASKLTRDVDKVGRALVWSSGAVNSTASLDLALVKAKERSEAFKRVDVFPLIGSITFSNQADRESFVASIFQFFTDIFTVSDYLGTLVCSKLMTISNTSFHNSILHAARYARYILRPIVCFNEMEVKTTSLFEVLFRFNFLLPKDISDCFTIFFMKTFTIESVKFHVTSCFLNAFHDLNIAYVKGYGVRETIILDQSVQLCTTPSSIEQDSCNRQIVKYLCNIAVDLFDGLLFSDGTLVAQTRQTLEFRHEYVLHSLLYVLRLNISTLLEAKTKKICEKSMIEFLNLVGYCHYLVKSKRHLGIEHIEEEDRSIWKKYSFYSTFPPLIKYFVNQVCIACSKASSDKFESANRVSTLFYERIKSNTSQASNGKFDYIFVLRLLPDEQKSICVPTSSVYDGDPFSFHLPFHRLISIFVRKMFLNWPEFTNLSMLNERDVNLLIDEPLKTIAATLQIMALMWRKSGNTIYSQAYFYMNNSTRAYFRPDYYLLQLGMVFIPAKTFLCRLLRSVGLLHLFCDDSILGHKKAEKSEYVTQLLESFIIFLSRISYDIPSFCNTGVDGSRLDVLHFLATRPKSLSAFRKFSQPYDFDPESLGIDSYFSLLGERKKNVYTLKDKFWCEVEPTYFLYSKQDTENVFQNKSAALDRMGYKTYTCAAPQLVSIPQMRPCLNFFAGKCFLFGFLREVCLLCLKGFLVTHNVNNDFYPKISRIVTFFDFQVLTAAIHLVGRVIRITESLSSSSCINFEAKYEDLSLVEILIYLYFCTRSVSTASNTNKNIAWIVTYICNISNESSILKDKIYDRYKNMRKRKGKVKKNKSSKAKLRALARIKGNAEKFDEKIRFGEELILEPGEDSCCSLCRANLPQNKTDLCFTIFAQETSWGNHLTNLFFFERCPVGIGKIKRVYAGYSRVKTTKLLLESTLGRRKPLEHNKISKLEKFFMPPVSSPEYSQAVHICTHFAHRSCLRSYSSYHSSIVPKCPTCKSRYNLLLPAIPLDFTKWPTNEISEAIKVTDLVGIITMLESTEFKKMDIKTKIEFKVKVNAKRFWQTVGELCKTRHPKSYNSTSFVAQILNLEFRALQNPADLLSQLSRTVPIKQIVDILSIEDKVMTIGGDFYSEEKDPFYEEMIANILMKSGADKVDAKFFKFLSPYCQGDQGMLKIDHSKNQKIEEPAFLQKGSRHNVSIDSRTLFSFNVNSPPVLGIKLGWSHFCSMLVCVDKSMPKKLASTNLSFGDYLVQVEGINVVGITFMEVVQMILKHSSKERVSFTVIRYAEYGSLLDIENFSVLCLEVIKRKWQVRNCIPMLKMIFILNTVASIVRYLRRGSKWYHPEIHVQVSATEKLTVFQDKFRPLWIYVVSFFAFQDSATHSFERIIPFVVKDLTYLLKFVYCVLHVQNDFERLTFKPRSFGDSELYDFFGLPDIDNILECNKMKELITGWINQFKKCNPLMTTGTELSISPKFVGLMNLSCDLLSGMDVIKTKNFVPLPLSYEILYTICFNVSWCPTSGKRGKNMSLCLRCGCLLCCCEDCCESIVVLESHFFSSCFSPFILLSTSETVTIEASTTQGMKFKALKHLYLDINGESDKKLRRGRSLYLSKENLAEIETKATTGVLTQHGNLVENVFKFQALFPGLT